MTAYLLRDISSFDPYLLLDSWISNFYVEGFYAAALLFIALLFMDEDVRRKGM